MMYEHDEIDEYEYENARIFVEIIGHFQRRVDTVLSRSKFFTTSLQEKPHDSR